LRSRRGLGNHPLEQVPQLVRHQPLNDRDHDRSLPSQMRCVCNADEGPA
jgi:hypothetical protein